MCLEINQGYKQPQVWAWVKYFSLCYLKTIKPEQYKIEVPWDSMIQ